MPVTDEELDNLEALLATATPGPWRSMIEGRDHDSGDSFIMTAKEDIYLIGATLPDQDFMAAARNAIPALISELRLRRAQS